MLRKTGASLRGVNRNKNLGGTAEAVPFHNAREHFYGWGSRPYTPRFFPVFPLGRGHFATITVEIPPRGRKSPFTSAHTGFAHRTTSSSTRLTMFS